MSARAGSIQQFLLIYDRKRDEPLSRELLGNDTVAATTAYRIAEIGCQDHPGMGIMLVGVEPLETIKVTYSTYFTESAAHLLDEIRAGVS